MFGVMSLSRRLGLPLAFCVLLCGSVAAGEESPLAIKGYDPVAYFTLQRAVPGVAQFTYEWDEHRWQFANAEHRDLFKADPVRYAPQFETFCAVSLAHGELHEASPEYWLIIDDKLYLFGKSIGPELFRKDYKAMVEQANRNRELLSKKVLSKKN
jgi:hypothetical protein